MTETSLGCNASGKVAKKVQAKAKSKRQRARGGSDWRPAFLAAYVQTGIEIDACEAVPVAVSTVWKERKRSPEFAALHEEARQMGALLLVKEATRRARDGVRKLKFDRGSPILDPATGKQYVEHEYSDTLLLALLKRHFPNEYRENVKHDVTGEVTHRVVRLPAKELAE